MNYSNMAIYTIPNLKEVYGFIVYAVNEAVLKEKQNKSFTEERKANALKYIEKFNGKDFPTNISSEERVKRFWERNGRYK